MSNDLALNSLAEGILTYLASKTETPLEGLAVLGIAACMFYDTCMDQSRPFAVFAEDFKRSLIDTHTDKSSTGPGTMQ